MSSASAVADVGVAAGWGVVGGARAVATLQRMVAAERVPHALLIVGPAQVGKSRVALGLARALNCLAPAEGEATPVVPCGQCRACQRIDAGAHADVEIVAPGGLCRVAEHDHRHSRSIGICAIRRLEMAAIIQPYEGRRRVYILDPTDALTAEAADAFLKTLEEPPAAVTFLLVTSRPALLPETVRSRCRSVTVAPLAVKELAAWLEAEQGLAADEARMLAQGARGRVGAALAELREGDPRARQRAQREEIRRLCAAGRAERFAYAEALAGRRGQVDNTLLALEGWIDWWRDMLLSEAGCEDGIRDQEEWRERESASHRYAPAQICKFLGELHRTRELIRQGVSARLALEALLVDVPAPRESADNGRTEGGP